MSARLNDWMCVCFAVVAAALAGCGGDMVDGSGIGGDHLGATPGGAQDIAYARALINAGSIPPFDAITVEGLLSEHDLPVMGDPCEDVLCVRPVAGLAPDLSTGKDEMWVHLGMTSGLSADFVRPPIDIVVVIDKSASMSIDMAETNDAVMDILAQIRADDRVAVVAFDDSVRTIVQPVRGADLDRPAADTVIRGLRAAGGANMMGGLERGYALARGMESGSDRMARVIVLSCGYPDAGDTSENSFVTLVEQGSKDRIGMTFLGVLLSFDYRLAQRLSSIRGGNYFFVEDLDSLTALFETDFDTMVTPLAYELQLKLGVDPTQWRLDRVYGLPGEPDADEAGFAVSTAFASRRGGGIVARMTPAQDNASDAVAHVSLSYDPETALGWPGGANATTAVSSSAGLPNVGVRKSVALVNMAERMKTAIQTGDRAMLVELSDYLTSESAALGDPTLAAEAELVDKLVDLF